MIRFTLTHELDCTPEQFWGLYFDPEFNQALFMGELGYSEYRVLEQEDTGSTIVRRSVYEPKVKIPGPVAKVLGARFRLTEDGTFDKTTEVWQFRFIPSTLSDKIRAPGTLKAERRGDSTTLRHLEMSVEANVFGIGGMLERAFQASLTAEMEKSVPFVHAWLKRGASRPALAL